jgi:hypothetical protein
VAREVRPEIQTVDRTKNIGRVIQLFGGGRIRCHHLRAAALFLAASLAAAAPAHAEGKWRAGAPIPQGANEVIGTNEVFDTETSHGFAAAGIGRTIYAVSGVNNAGGAGTVSVVPVNEIFEE